MGWGGGAVCWAGEGCGHGLSWGHRGAALKTMLILYEFPLMGLPFAQDHEIIPSESGLDHSAHRYLGKASQFD